MATPDDMCIEDQRFLEILSMEGTSLQLYYQQDPLLAMFPNAQNIPQFFNDNLVSDDRVVKHFANNAQSNFRIFYYQLLRLGYQIKMNDGSNKQFIHRLKLIVFNPEFQILFTKQTEDERQVFNDFQFKRFFAEFIVLLQSQQQVTIEDIMSYYPFMDNVFIHILRSILVAQNINEQFEVKIQTQIVFQQLSSLIGLQIVSYGTCWKFEDSDMFCYEQNQNNLYLAYIDGDDDQEEDDQQEQNQRNIEHDQIEQQSIQIQQPVHPAAIRVDSKIIYNQHINQVHSSQQTPPYEHPNHTTQTPQFQTQNRYQQPYRKQEQSSYQRQYQSFGQVQSRPTRPQPQFHQTQSYQSSYQSPGRYQQNNNKPNYQHKNASETFRSNYSKPTASMITQNYQFTDYLGVTTTQKHKVPKHIKDYQSKPCVQKDYDKFLNKVDSKLQLGNLKNQFNNKPFQSYSKNYHTQRSNPEQQRYQKYQRYQPKYQQRRPSYQKQYKRYEPPAYYNNNNIRSNINNRQSSQYFLNNKHYNSIQSTGNKINKFEPVELSPMPFVKYRNALSSFSYVEDIPYQNTQTFKSSQFSQSSNYYQSYKQPQLHYPVRPVTKFKPVSPTPMPDLSKYTKNNHSRSKNSYQDSTYQYSKTQRKPFHFQKYQPSKYQSIQYSTYQPTYKTNPITYKSSREGDYYNDFTSPDILSKLRSQNRQNISKIKQVMRGVRKGQQIPESLNIRKSAIFENNFSPSKQQLFRNQSRSQFQYSQSHKKPVNNKFQSYSQFKQYQKNNATSLFSYD